MWRWNIPSKIPAADAVCVWPRQTAVPTPRPRKMHFWTTVQQVSVHRAQTRRQLWWLPVSPSAPVQRWAAKSWLHVALEPTRFFASPTHDSKSWVRSSNARYSSESKHCLSCATGQVIWSEGNSEESPRVSCTSFNRLVRPPGKQSCRCNTATCSFSTTARIRGSITL